MTNREIDKILSMLDTNDLNKLKEYLNNLKRGNNEKIVQDCFEKYLTTNIFGYNWELCPKLYEESGKQIFTNCASIYIINSNYFKTNTKTFDPDINKNRRHTHRFKIINKDDANFLLKMAEKNKKGILVEPDSIETNITEKLYEFYHENNFGIRICTNFNSKEINTCDTLLNNPKYKIYTDFPLIEAESDIGKAYIMGIKKNPNF